MIPLFGRQTAPFFRVLFALALIIVTWLGVSPDPLPSVNWSAYDKLAHFATYALLGMLIDASWPEQPFGVHKWLALIAYGTFIELVQSQVPNRMFSLADVVANTAGIALYAFVFARFCRTYLRR